MPLPSNPDGFTLTYRFQYAPPPNLLAINTTTNNVIGNTFNVVGFTVSWVLEGFGELVNFAGGTSQVSLPLLGAGIYDLVLRGTAIGGQGGFVNYSLVANTPIPGAVVLFGSVLAGGIGGVQLMRRRRAAQVA